MHRLVQVPPNSRLLVSELSRRSGPIKRALSGNRTTAFIDVLNMNASLPQVPPTVCCVCGNAPRHAAHNPLLWYFG
jgi:hypothetical protein